MKAAISKKKLIIQILTTLISVYLISFPVLFYFDNISKKIQRNSLLDINEIDTSLKKATILRNFDDYMDNLHFLEDTLNSYLDKELSYNQLTNIWNDFSETFKIFDQIRFIDSAGNEVVRINYQQNAITVPKGELQNKKNRYYFEKTMNLKNSERHYFSKIDLNVEQGQIEMPIKPMLRISSRIVRSGKTIGIIILNVNIQTLLEELFLLKKNNISNTYILNKDSYWIFGGSPEENWAFMYPDRKDINFRNSYPDEWERILKGDKQIVSDSKFFIVKDINIEDSYHINIESENVVTEDYYKLVSVIDLDSEKGYVFYEKPFRRIQRILKENKINFIFLTILGITLNLFYYFIKRSNEKIKKFSSHDHLTNSLDRKSGFKYLEKIISEHINEDICVCYISMNSLSEINNRWGNSAGDQAIITTTHTIKKNIRKKDIFIRLNGDEFLVVLLGVDSVFCEKIWNRILKDIETINIRTTNRYMLSICHGIVESKIINLKMLEKVIQVAAEKMLQEKKKMKSAGINIVKKNSDL